VIVLAAVLAAMSVVLLPSREATVLGATSAVLVNPVLGIMLVSGGFIYFRVSGMARQRRSKRAQGLDQHLAVDLAALGVTSGLSFDQAALAAGDRIGGVVADSITRTVRRAQSGLRRDLEDGPVSDMFAAAGRSSASGAPMSAVLADLARHGRQDLAAQAQERIEKLPVKLLFPLAFLILPGFVLVAVVPAVVSGLSKLGF